MHQKLFLFSLLLSVVLSACTSTLRPSAIPMANTSHTIYFIYRGWHTSILIDAKELKKQNPLLAEDLNGQKYGRIGWGDGDYFTGKNKSVATATKALIASRYSAIQLLPYDYDPFDEIPTETWVPLALTEQGMQNLLKYINSSIATDENRQLKRLPAFGGAQGSFFESKDRYSLFNNCNTWSLKALRAAGLPVTSRLTSKGAFEQATRIAEYQAKSGNLAQTR